MLFRTRFTPERLARPVVDMQGELENGNEEARSMTQQNFKRECDINFIMKRFEETGYLTDPLKSVTRQPMFGEFHDLPDYQASQDMLNEAEEAFYSLPSAVRKRFSNDPMSFVEFMSDESNLEEARSLGLVASEPVLDPVSAFQVTPEE
ncbi:internal scaffolding protein [Chifec microvirus UA13_18]|nr:internal scaffolding protein [Chifec microvirus UA13_18]